MVAGSNLNWDAMTSIVLTWSTLSFACLAHAPAAVALTVKARMIRLRTIFSCLSFSFGNVANQAQTAL
jgi:hypothetical protein